MKSAEFIIGSYVMAVVVLGGYAASILRRARRVGSHVPPERRPWT